MASVTKHPPLKDPSNNAVRVEIFDQAYNLRGSDAEYIIKLAEYVDSKMRAVAEQTHTVDTARLAVLAALNSRWQVDCQLFTSPLLPISEVFPSILSESRPARLVMVVTDF